ncbi:site-specific DNA-methyltransferase [Rhizobium ruizarguesonis]|uniref:site-specific DNA-methyltransferase n=1 Tax=Rhizobium ruizarguesonis TaxID=2081791 RepID=UPI00102F8BAE|nr:site-specific DNA-methyltransferase [Rhizobium ruizarguesonis]TBA18765.1 site-specific DNA-methyltransferase [Rhizobium ruizarguesonis]
MATKTKLELTWIGKDRRPRLEPRILIEEEHLSHHASSRREGDHFDNVLIRGDNLLGLKALEATHTGSVKCVFIDPPYNTGSAFEHYDDGVEHSVWLSLMRERLEIIHRLMSDDGLLWVTLDDNEAHYFKVMCDEIFGRKNFISNVIWEKSDSPKMDSRYFSSRHDHIFVYAKDIEVASISRIISNDVPKHFSKTDESGRPYYTKPLRAMGSGDDTRAARPTLYFPITAPDGTEVYPMRPDGVEGRWRWSQARVQKDISEIEWVQGKGGWSAYYRIYAETSTGRPAETIWPHAEVGSNRTSKIETQALFEGIAPFTTPKPERLLEKIIRLSTEDGDLVLDSFAGSGTTGAVAHKMGRRWIMVELGDHCETHIVPRMKKVINGADSGGITERVGWKGGGGYRYFRLAPSLLEKDQFDNWVISKAYNAEMLAEAMCTHFSFTYQPSTEHYWMHGNSSETDFIYVTTNSLTHEQLAAISEDVGPERTLLICCKAFQGGNADAFDNLTIRKIPGAILDRCEWGKDDYSLKIEALPLIEGEPEEEADEAPRRKSAVNPTQPSLFSDDEEAEA